MKLNALNRSFSNIVQKQKESWHWGAGGQHWLKQDKLERRPARHTALLENPGQGDARPKLWVEDIKVSADKNYMYCKGCVRSQGSRSKSNVVVAVEWLDEDQKAVNTDWKRIEMHLDGKTVPLLPNTLRPFMVKAPLDRRVKWVKAYAFSGNL
ncbi:hypothetical protein D1BOALGB6SA_1747 [Olavius sp. associated proteobacterium Delta 1]|nr:hypothetical protein D1BOALGB6SA_1747 [Olavius sp. associated proteobacterium Delta 1]